MLSLTYISQELISIRLGNISIYYIGHIPIAFRTSEEAVMRESSGAILSGLQEVKLIEEYSNRKIVKKSIEEFNHALKKAYKSALYAETSKLTLGRMGFKNDNTECDPSKSRNFTVRSFHERLTGDGRGSQGNRDKQ